MSTDREGTRIPGPGEKLRIGWLLVQVWRVYRRRWKLLVPLAVLVLIPQALADAILGGVQIERVHSITDVVALLSIPVTLAINLGGEALYAGIIAAGVSEWLQGRELRDLGTVARSISYGRLIAIDLILVLGTAVGLLFLVVPGIVFYTYLVISPALVELDEMRVRPALRRSVELVRGSFWRVLAFSAIVLLLGDFLAALLESPLHGVPGEAVFNLAIEAVIEPFQGLTTVMLALALLGIHGADDRLRRFAQAPHRTGL